MGFVKQEKLSRVLCMLKEIKDNMLNLKTIDSDLVELQREIILGYIDIIINDISIGLAPNDILASYLLDLQTYIVDLEITIDRARACLLRGADSFDLPNDIQQLLAAAL
jgi:hypothetical protein